MPTFKAIQVFEYTEEFEFEAADLWEARRILGFVEVAMANPSYRLKSTKIFIDTIRGHGFDVEPITPLEGETSD